MKIIYVRKNLVNGKQYVGQTSDIKRRERDWKKLNTSYSNKELNEDRIKYGLENWGFNILEEVDDSIADETERKYIESLNTIYPNGYNRYSGGVCGFSFSMSEETKIKIRKRTKGIQKSEEFKKRVSESLKNHTKKSKIVYQYTIDKKLVSVYPSAREAARETGFSQGNISNCCKGGFFSKRRNKWVNKKQSYGYIWSYTPL